MLVAEGFLFLPATLVLPLCYNGAIMSLLGSVCVHVEREKERASQREGEGGGGGTRGRYSLLSNVKNSILFRLALNCEVDW